MEKENIVMKLYTELNQFKKQCVDLLEMYTDNPANLDARLYNQETLFKAKKKLADVVKRLLGYDPYFYDETVEIVLKYINERLEEQKNENN